MRSEWLVAGRTPPVIVFAIVLMASLASADDTGHDHSISNQLVDQTNDFEGVVIERLLTEAAVVISVSLGSFVQLRLTTPEPSELHFHGYDISAAAGPQTVALMTFHAEHSGRFPIVSHTGDDLLGRAEKTLAYIEVLPE